MKILNLILFLKFAETELLKIGTVSLVCFLNRGEEYKNNISIDLAVPHLSAHNILVHISSLVG